MGNQPFAIVCQVHYDNSAIMTFEFMSHYPNRTWNSPAISDEFAQELRIVNLELADAGDFTRPTSDQSISILELMHCRFGLSLSLVTISVYRQGNSRGSSKGSIRARSRARSRSELHLNRRFLVRKLGEPESQQIYAAILLDLAGDG